ncbi:leucyl/phenylalanyl-tRNA--protein transferase [Psychromonas sp. CNPT3]|uniref:leucyl/phenylalanyl-tRNA--protein transferase n=1 Tax=Psychromonas sp. CNPT3 TaxID=314282 RepID=UPI00006E48BD|nr:leucyl/phenylalanyl-tRNA--protein transferase [Psychromonas sp. CNPT3]AGH80944.1 leucyl/phenylalanyl-tRNA--protein transferase [Psychromonas sp. CNPT3]
MKNHLTTLTNDPTLFPNVSHALEDPEGLLAIGGDLHPLRIINAYQRGIFPWYNEGEPLLWWSPNERATILAGKVHISKSMRRLIRKENYTLSINKHFSEVIHACAAPRKGQPGTWITAEMIDAYLQLHQQGWAHSVEVFRGNELVGGLYGIGLGQIFCGESMFSRSENASKMAFIALHQHFHAANGKLIDCQMLTPHLASLGVQASSRADFIKQLKLYQKNALKLGCWQAQTLTLSTIF